MTIFQIGDTVSWKAGNGQETGEIIGYYMGTYVIRLKGGRCVLAGKESLVKG